MLHVSSVALKNVVTYKQAKFRIDAQPLAVIRGQNLDRRHAQAANAVGKTLLAHAIPNVFYATPPMGTRKNSARDLLDTGTSSITINCHKDKNKYRITQYSKGRSIRYRISKNGVDLKIERIADAQKFIRSLVPTEEQLYTTAFLSPRDFNVLARGKTEQRFDFFENIFNLGAYDAMLGKISKVYAGLKQSKQQQDVLQREQDQLHSHKPVKELLARQAELDRDIKILKQRIEKYHAKNQQLTRYRALVEDLDVTTPVPKLVKQLQHGKAKLESCQKHYATAIAHQQIIKQNAKINKTVAQLQERIMQLPPASFLVKTEQRFDEIVAESRAEIDVKEQARDKFLAEEETRAELIKQIAGLHIPEKWQNANLSSRQINSLLQQARERVNQNNKLIQGFDVLVSNHAKTCPTCQQKVDIRQIKIIVSNTQDNNKKLTRKIDILRQLGQYQTLDEQLSALPKISKKRNLARLLDELDTAEHLWMNTLECRSGFKMLHKMRAEQVQLKSMLRELPDKQGSDPERWKNAVTKYTKLIEKLSNTIERRKQVQDIQIDPDKAAKLQKKYNRYIKLHQPTLDELVQRHSQLQVKVAQRQVHNKQWQHLQSQIEQLADKTKDLPIYTALRDAYGAKGLRIMHIRNLAQMYCQRLNKYAHLIYDEPIKFSVAIERGSFSIMAERNNKISDVRRLSGYEASGFILLSLLALLPFVPHSMRINFLFIDEIETGMDRGNMRKIAEEFIPVLNKIIPNIVIITPRSVQELNFPDAVEYMVVKKNGQSILQKGA